MARLSRTAEEFRARLALTESRLERQGDHLPKGVLEGLRQMSSTLLLLQQTIQGHEAQRQGLAALADIGQVINSSLELEVVLNEVIDTLIRLTGAGRAFMMLRGESGEMKTVAARNWERESLDPAEVEVSRTIVDRVLMTGEPVLTTNAQSDPRFEDRESIVAYNLLSILCVPLKAKGALIGVIYADNKVREGLFTERERSLLSGFANQAAVALENARLFESVRNTLDEVTDLKNLMEDVFASIASGVITADAQGSITLVNRAAEKILGRARDDLLGTHLLESLPGPPSDMAHQLVQVEEHDRRYVGLEVDATTEQRRLTLRMSLSPLKRASGGTQGVAIVLEDLTEQRRLEAQKRLFERMVSPVVIDQLDPDSLQLGGQVREITTLFADIRGFTSFSEGTDPERLVAILNRYLTVATEAVLEAGGTIDKFLGDAVMAWFNAPVAQPDHALRAVQAARAMRRAVQTLNAELDPSMQLSFGIGLHTGEALLGLVGSEQRLDYTAIGDSVNTAKRLQEHARAGQILISKTTLDQIDVPVEVRSLHDLELEGKQQRIEVLEVLGQP